MESPSMSSKLLAKLWTVNNLMAKRVDNKLGLHGISLTEFLVMLHLHGQKGKQARRSDLAENIGLSASGVTRMLAPMEKIGLVQKEKNLRDARVSLVKLTRAGERVLAESMVSVNEIADTIFSGFKPKTIENLFNEISRLSEIKI